MASGQRGGGGPHDEELSTVLRGQALPTFAPSARFFLEVVDGPDRGASFLVEGTRPSRIFVGKGPSCDLQLSDAMVSRRHAGLDVRDNELRLADLESKNGTFANGIRVAEAFLRGGETLHVGETVLRVTRVEDGHPVELPHAGSFGKLVGASVEMRRLYPLCAKLAASDVAVVIEGETGTGKEVLAEALHEAGPRASGPFIVFDCTAVPANLLESELFGHERGAFTGAVSTRKGVFEQAHGGTLLIDEIGDLDIALQPKLLRAVQRSEVRRVGGDRFIPVDVRVLSATRRDLDREVQAGRFRDDLFFRLAVARIELPPLRARRGDVGLLAAHFWGTLRGTGALPYDLLQRCEEYAWPGNVRELYNEVSRRIALGDLAMFQPTSQSTPSTYPPATSSGIPGDAAAPHDLVETVLGLGLPLPRARQRMVEEFDRRYVERVVAQHGGNIVRAAAASGIAHRYFQLLRARQAKR